MTNTPRLTKAEREAAFRAERNRIRRNQNAVYGFDPGVHFVEGERHHEEDRAA